MADWLTDAVDAVAREQRAKDRAARAAVAQAASNRQNAADVDLARRSGLPLDTVRAKRDQVTSELAAREANRSFDQLTSKSQDWLANPTNAASAVGDLGTVRSIGSAFGSPQRQEIKLGDDIWRSPTLDSIGFYNLPRSGRKPTAQESADMFNYSQREQQQSFDRAQAEAARNRPPPTLRNLWNGTAIDTVQGWRQSWIGTKLYLADAMGLSQEGDVFQGLVGDLRESQLTAARNRPNLDGSMLGNAVYGGVTSFFQTVPALVAGALTGGTAGVLALAGTQTGSSAYGKYRVRGGTANEALLGGTLEGAIEAGTELLPTKYLLGNFGSKGVAGFVTGFLGREMLGEQLATLGQDAVDTAIANPTATWAQYWSDRPMAAFNTAVATVIASSAIGGGSALTRSLKGAAHQVDDATAAFTDHSFLDNLVSSARNSPMRQTDPQGFREFVETQAEGTPVDRVYVPGDAVRSMFQSEGIDYHADPFWGQYAQQIDEAAALNGDVVLPIADAVTEFASSNRWDTLRDSVRLSPGGISVAEARSIAQSYQDLMQDRGDEVRSTLEAQAEELAPVRRVYEAVFDQTRKAGMSPNAATAYADLFAARYAARAEQRGTDAWTLFNQSLGGIVGEAPEAVRRYDKADQLDRLVNAMRANREGPSASKRNGPSLLEWIASRGGVEDPGGDLKASGLDNWHREAPFRRKLIKESSSGQGALAGLGPSSSPNRLDNVALAAWEAGFFPEFQTRPETSDLIDAMAAETRGQPRYMPNEYGGPNTDDDVRAAADDLRNFLYSRDVDPDTATDAEIRAAIEQADESTSRALEQRLAALEGNDTRLFYQTQANHPFFYSALSRAVEASKTTKAPAAQWLSTLRNAPGVKAEELEWSGLVEFLEGLNGSIGRQDVLDFLYQGGIAVDEVVLGEVDNRAAQALAAQLLDETAARYARAALDDFDPFDDNAADHVPAVEESEGLGEGEIIYSFDGVDYATLDEAEEARDAAVGEAVDEAERQRYYDAEARARSQLNEDDFIDQAKEQLNEITQFGSWTSTNEATPSYRELLITLPLGKRNNPRNAPETHWTQPAVVAHARFQTKRDAQGRPILFVEEVQSDWHQKGRDEGYEVKPSAAEVAQAYAALEEAKQTLNDASVALEALGRAQDVMPPDDNPATDGRRLSVGYQPFRLDDAPLDERVSYADVGLARLMRGESSYQREVGDRPFDAKLQAEVKELRAAWRAARLRVDEATQSYRNAAMGSRGIPQAPFKSSWPALVMKRMIRWAADNGFHSVAWTTGEQQNERYSLVQPLEGVIIRPAEDGLIEVAPAVFTQEQAEILLPAGGKAGPSAGSRLLTQEEATSFFGEEVGSRMFSREGVEPFKIGTVDWFEFATPGIEKGGDGMRGFYDRNLVNITNDLVKKYGARVAPIEVLEDEMGFTEQWANEAAALRLMADRFEAQGEMIRAENSRQEAQQKEDRLRREGQPKQQWGFEVTDKLAQAARGGFSLFQGGDLKARGRIDFDRDNKAVIRLFEGRDLSTLLHEGGHLWLEELKADAQRPDAPQQVKDDWATVRAWFRANGFRVKQDGEVPTDAHELWARGMERYLMEGKAPSSALQRAFSTFRSWLLRIYQVVANLNSPVTPEVRQVMDRLFATQQAINEMAAEDENALLFKSAADAGMTEAEFQAYKDSATYARSAAFDALLFRTMENIRRARTAEWKRERRGVRAEVEKSVRQRPEFRALALLRGQGDTRVQLNREAVVAETGADAIALLPRGVPPTVVEKGGVHPQVLAELSGFRTAEELLDMLIGVEKRQRELRASGDKRSVFQEEVERLTEQTMLERHGDVLADGSIEEEALGVIHNNQRAEVIASEVRALSRRTKRVGDQVPTPWRVAREFAEARVRSGTVADEASAAALARHRRNEGKAARAAEAAMLAGNVDEAYRQKQAQMFHHALFRAAKEAKDQIAAIQRRLEKFANSNGMASMDPEYLDRIHELLEAYDFKVRTQRSLRERQSFVDWARSKEEAGEEIVVPPRLADAGRVNFTKLPVQDLIGLDDAVQSLAHLGRRKKKLLAAREEADFEVVVDEAVASAEALPSRKVTTERNEPSGWRKRARDVDALIVKVEFLADQLDGNNPNGAFNRVLIRGATDAANRKEALVERVLRPLVDLYNGMPKAQQRRLAQKVVVPELVTRDAETGEEVATTYSRSELLAIALNTGNESNLSKMLRGESLGLSEQNAWTMDKVQAVLDRELNQEDWQFVQAVWRQVDSLWPDIVRAEREITGLTPEKVEARMVQTQFGTIPGGYYPVVFDPTRSIMASANYEDDAERLLGQMGRAVSTPKGHTITRTEAAAPLLLNLEAVLFNHVNRVTTRIAYGRFVRDALKFTSHPKVREVVNRKLGPEYHRQFRSWLRRQVNDAAMSTEQLAGIDRVLRQFRINTTMVGLGFRFTTMLAQTAGLATSASELSPRWLAAGMAEAVSNMGSIRSFVFERSPEMATRAQSFDRDMRAFFSDMRVEQGSVSRATKGVLDPLRGAAFWAIGNIQLFSVDMPTWLGAYRKGLNDGMTEEEAAAYGDKLVRRTQGAGRPKDLAAIQDAAEGYRVLTLFYSWFNVLYNKQRDTLHQAKTGDWRRASANVLWLMMVSPLLSALLTGDDPNEENEEDWLQWAVRKFFFGLWAGVPGIRDVAGGVERKVAGRAAFPTTSPFFRAFDEIQKPITDAIKVSKGDEPSDRWIQNAITAPGYFVGLPTGQVGATAQYVYDWAQGKQQPQTVGEVAKGLSKGPQKDQQ